MNLGIVPQVWYAMRCAVEIQTHTSIITFSRCIPVPGYIRVTDLELHIRYIQQERTTN